MFLSLIAQVFPAYQVGQQFISDNAVHELTQAGVAMVTLLVLCLIVWVVIKPLISSRSAKDSTNDAVTNGLLKQSADAHDDNRRLIEVIERGREDDRVQTAAITALTVAIEGQAGAIKDQTGTTMKLIDVAMSNIQLSEQSVQQLPGIIQEQHDKTIEKVTEATAALFNKQDERIGEMAGDISSLQNALTAFETKVDQRFEGLQTQLSDQRMKTLLEEMRTQLRKDVQEIITEAIAAIPGTGNLQGRPATGPDDKSAPVPVEVVNFPPALTEEKPTKE